FAHSAVVPQRRHPTAPSSHSAVIRQRLDHVSGVHTATAEDPAVQSGSVDQRFEHRLVDHLLEILARNIETPAVQHGLTDPETSPDEMVQRNVAGNEVTSGLRGRQIDPVIARQRLQRLGLDQGHLSVLVRAIRVVTDTVRVTITLDTVPGNETCLITLDHRGTGSIGNEYPRQSTAPRPGVRTAIDIFRPHVHVRGHYPNARAARTLLRCGLPGTYRCGGRTAGHVERAIGAPMPGSICVGPDADGRMSKSKISVGI